MITIILESKFGHTREGEFEVHKLPADLPDCYRKGDDVFRLFSNNGRDRFIYRRLTVEDVPRD